MIRFRAKEFSAAIIGKKVQGGLKKGWGAFKEYGTPIMGMGSLGLSTAYYLDAKRKKASDKIYQDKQLDAMNKLTNELQNTSSTMNRVSSSMDNFNKNHVEEPVQQPKKQKNSSFLGRLRRIGNDNN